MILFPWQLLFVVWVSLHCFSISTRQEYSTDNRNYSAKSYSSSKKHVRSIRSLQSLKQHEIHHAIARESESIEHKPFNHSYSNVNNIYVQEKNSLDHPLKSVKKQTYYELPSSSKSHDDSGIYRDTVELISRSKLVNEPLNIVYQKPAKYHSFVKALQSIKEPIRIGFRTPAKHTSHYMPEMDLIELPYKIYKNPNMVYVTQLKNTGTSDLSTYLSRVANHQNLIYLNQPVKPNKSMLMKYPVLVPIVTKNPQPISQLVPFNEIPTEGGTVLLPSGDFVPTNNSSEANFSRNNVVEPVSADHSSRYYRDILLNPRKSDFEVLNKAYESRHRRNTNVFENDDWETGRSLERVIRSSSPIESQVAHLKLSLDVTCTDGQPKLSLKEASTVLDSEEDNPLIANSMITHLKLSLDVTCHGGQPKVDLKEVSSELVVDEKKSETHQNWIKPPFSVPNKKLSPPTDSKINKTPAYLRPSSLPSPSIPVSATSKPPLALKPATVVFRPSLPFQPEPVVPGLSIPVLTNHNLPGTTLAEIQKQTNLPRTVGVHSYHHPPVFKVGQIVPLETTDLNQPSKYWKKGSRYKEARRKKGFNYYRRSHRKNHHKVSSKAEPSRSRSKISDHHGKPSYEVPLIYSNSMYGHLDPERYYSGKNPRRRCRSGNC